jgi:hypothetical protein
LGSSNSSGLSGTRTVLIFRKAARASRSAKSHASTSRTAIRKKKHLVQSRIHPHSAKTLWTFRAIYGHPRPDAYLCLFVVTLPSGKELI